MIAGMDKKYTSMLINKKTVSRLMLKGIVCGILIAGIYKLSSRAIEDYALSMKRKAEWSKLGIAVEKKVKNFQGIIGVVIKDLTTGREINFNKNVLLPSASLVKVPIMLSCFYASQEGKLNLDKTVSLKSSEKVSGSKVLGSLPSSSQFTIAQLFSPMITQSDNTATNIIIETMGFDALNKYFKKIGLKNTNLSRKMLDFEEREAGVENYTTAGDTAYLFEKLYAKNFLNKKISERCLEILKNQKINDRIPRKLPKREMFIAHKTGLEKHICHDAGIVFTRKGNFLICVLVKHDDKFAFQAKKTISALALLTYNYYKSF